MTKKILHYINKGVEISLVALLLASCFVIDKSLFNGIITSKHLWVQLFSIVTMVFIGVKIFLAKKINIQSVDILFAVFVLWMIGRELLSEMPYANPQQNLINIATYSVLYLFFRLIGDQTSVLISVLIIYLIIVSAQATLGLLQLYGFLTSHHNLFNITGSFHNPGPFSGFIVSGLPMALALYLMTKVSTKVDNRIGERTIFKKPSVISHWLLVNSDKLLNYFAQFVIVVLLLVLPAARSRAAWLGGVLGCIYVFYKVKGFGFEKVLGSVFRVDLQLSKVHSSKFSVNLLLRKVWCLVFGINAKREGDVIQLKTQNPSIAEHGTKPINNSNKPRTSNSKLKIASLSILIVSTFIISCYGLYKMKNGSADGRLLMWQVSWEMIKDKPFMGWGQDGFEANYANYQAEWFKSGIGTSEQEMLAGMPDAPFNELIRIGVEYGLIGVLIVLCLLFFVFKPSRNYKNKARNPELTTPDPKHRTLNPEYLIVILKSGLLSILIFSLFSYPVDVAPIMVQAIVLAAFIVNSKLRNSKKEYISHVKQPKTPNLKPGTQNSESKTYKLLPRLAIIPLLAIIPYVSHQTFNQYIGHKHWQEAYELYQYHIYDDAAEEYVKANKCIPNSGLLKQMFGKCLAMDEKWEEAKDILEEAKVFRADPILYCTMGSVYKNLKSYDKAEECYLQASNIIPHKFYSKYLLAKLYDKSGQNIQAKKMAKELLDKEIKVSSTAIKEMKTELKRLLQK